MSEGSKELIQALDRFTAEYGRDTYLLYAMGLHIGTLDLSTLRADCLLDGPDDKKIDFFYIDYDNSRVIIAQSYVAEDWSKPEPPANKASDLNTAVNWLLESELSTIPRDSIRAAAEQLRDGLHEGEILRIELFYVHNLTHSVSVDAELGTVQRAAQRLLERFGGGVPPECVAQQVSRDSVDKWRRIQHEAVSVHDSVTLTSRFQPQELHSSEWHAVVATIPAQELVELRAKGSVKNNLAFYAVIFGLMV